MSVPKFSNAPYSFHTELKKRINNYFEETTVYESDSLTIEGILKFYQQSIDFSKMPPPFINQNASYFRDLRIKTGENLFYSGYDAELNVNNFELTISRLESRESLYIFSQIYEAFESFLKNILKSFYENNGERINEVILLKQLLSESDGMSSMINKFQRKEKNNKKLFWLLRKLSTTFKDNEKDNCYCVDYSIWFDLMSDIRHLVVHNRQQVSNIFKESLKENRKAKIFEQYFRIDDILGKSYIVTSRINLNNINMHFGSLALLIFKCLSIEAKLDEKYIKTTPSWA